MESEPKKEESVYVELRKLASIQLIDEVVEHPNADALNLAKIGGWQIAIKKGEATSQQKVVYCEIDSLLPGDAIWLPDAVKDRVALQENKSFFRVKTIRLRGELSQGLIIPLSNFPQEMKMDETLEVNTDVTQILNIYKYDPYGDSEQVERSRGTGGPKEDPFPLHLVGKTDEIRVQSAPQKFKDLQGKPCYITLKCDGQSATYVLDYENNDKFLVCARNIMKKKQEGIPCNYHAAAEKYKIEEILRRNPSYAIQGELCGPNIQRNMMGLSEIQLFVFNVINIKTFERMNFKDMVKFCVENGLQTVQLIEEKQSFDFNTIADVLILAEGKYDGTNNEREGLVIRSMDYKTSFKAISNLYLEKLQKVEDKEERDKAKLLKKMAGKK